MSLADDSANGRNGLDGMSASRAARVYECLQGLLPRTFKNEHQQGMLEVVWLLAREAHGTGHTAGSVKFWLRAYLDLVHTALALRLSRGSVKSTIESPRPGDSLMSTLIFELKGTLRRLRRRPALAVIIVGMLACGVGANTAIFSMVDAVFLRPLPYADPAQLVAVWPGEAFSKDEFEYFRESMSSLDDLAGTWPAEVTWQASDHPERVAGARVTSTYFDLLGVRPVLGRVFAADETKQSAPLVILSHGLWNRRFGGTDDVIGQAVNLDGEPHEIVGVMPETFFSTSADVELWRPARMDSSRGDWYSVRRLTLIGRLRSNDSIEQATAEFKDLARQRRETYPKFYPDHYGNTASLAPLPRSILASYRTPLLLMQGAGLLVLLIACGKIAITLMATSVERSQDHAIRSALGARWMHILRQNLLESFVLCAMGAVFGLGLAFAGLGFLTLPIDLPSWLQVTLDVRALGFATALVLACTLGVGLLSIARLRWGGQPIELKGKAVVGRRYSRQYGLIALEVALSLILLIGAGVALRSFDLLRSVDPGFKTDRILTFRLDPPETEDAFADPQTRFRFYENLTTEVARLPGVESVGFGQQVALGDEPWGTRVQVEGQPSEDPGFQVRFMTVDADYFDVLSIPMLRGETFSPHTRPASPKVAIINQTMVEQIWGERDPLGARVRFGSRGDWMTVTGIVGDTKQIGLDQPDEPILYRPVNQSPQIVSLSMFIRTGTDPFSAMVPIRKAVTRTDSRVPISRVRTLDRVLEDSLGRPRLISQLLLLFSCVALILSLGGIFAVVSLMISQRKREIGLRMALGASPTQVSLEFAKSAFRSSVVGCILGLAIFLSISGALRGLVFGITPTDPMTLSSAVLVLLSAAVLATYIPARRSAHVDPKASLDSL